MKYPCSFLLIFLFLSLQNIANAQEKGTASIFVRPYNAFLKIDTQVFDLSKEAFPFEVELEEGFYTVELWAPTFEVHQVTFEIKSLKTTRVVKELKDLNVELQDKVDDKSFNTLAINSGVIIADIGLTALYFHSVKKSKDKLDIQSAQINELRQNHNLYFLPDDLENSRLLFDTQKNEFNKQRNKHNTKVILGGVGLGLAYGLTIYKFLKQSKNKQSRAVKQDKNPFVNLSIDLNNNSLSNFSPLSNKIVLKWTF